MKARKILKYFLIFFLVGFVIAVVARVVYRSKQADVMLQVEKIHNTKLQLIDVMGDNLPPDPGELADDTVEGVDANTNGIRDDVELAIFREYPNSAKTRAVLLQYALALQMQVIQPYVNEETVIATIKEEDRAYQCVGQVLHRDDKNEKKLNEYFQQTEFLRSFVENKQLNTTERKNFRTVFYEKINSYNSLDNYCDIDYSILPN